MKYLKAPGTAAGVVIALMAFVGAGSASATELTCTQPIGTKVMCPAETEFHAETEGRLVMDTLIGNIECFMSFEGKATTGSSTTTVSIPLSAVTFRNCGDNDAVNVKKPGTLEIHTRNAGADGNGTVTWVGAEIEMVGTNFSCTYTTGAGVDFGTLTGSSTTGSTATLDIEGKIPGDGFLCLNGVQWTGNMKVTAPDWLDVD